MSKNFTKEEMKVVEKFQQKAKIIDVSINAFVLKMREKMYNNIHKMLWKECKYGYLFKKLLEATEKLAKAIVNYEKENIIKESVDIANYAMMLSDIAEDDGVIKK
ncbi:MAG: hypothetical protein U9P90_02170 [Patescibacteria group bacterium]|nr:hypothetical protein [Patescibacteria group bacterium]